MGVDFDPRVVEMAKERYPDTSFEEAGVYDLSKYGTYDTVFAIGLYRKPMERRGLDEMIKHANKAVVLTYKHARKSEEPYFPEIFWGYIRGDEVKSIEIFCHNITAIEIVRFNL